MGEKVSVNCQLLNSSASISLPSVGNVQPIVKTEEHFGNLDPGTNGLSPCTEQTSDKMTNLSLPIPFQNEVHPPSNGIQLLVKKVKLPFFTIPAGIAASGNVTTLPGRNDTVAISESRGKMNNKVIHGSFTTSYFLAMPVPAITYLWTTNSPCAGKSNNSVELSEKKLPVGLPTNQQMQKTDTLSQSPKDDASCTICGKSFIKKSYLNTHLRRHNGEKPYKCEKCGKSFLCSSSLWAHRKIHSDEKPFLCEICGKRFSRKGNLEVHIMQHSGSKPYSCSLCNKSFKTICTLSQHKKRHTIIGRSHVCEICGKAFKTKCLYRSHVRIHDDNKRFVCHICDKNFLRKSELKKHTRTHTGERPYPCDVCGKAFSFAEGLRMHQRQHTNEEPYKCSECPKTFKSHSNMRVHRNTHFGIKPYSCKLCEKRFTQTHSLKKHIADKVCVK